jgi:ribose 1,5-bisphosphate isomerase
MGVLEDSLAQGASEGELRASLLKACDDFISWADSALEKVSQFGAELISDGDRVFTYSMSSTVWRVFKRAKAQGKNFSVWVTESRPSDEGFWTVREMDEAGIPVAVSIDGAIGELVPQCDSVFIGADAISSTGIALCKSGSYPTALVAHSHGVPFYIAADTLKFDPLSLVGMPFRPHAFERDSLLDEDYPDRVEVVGHYFDQTPPNIITAIITEIGLIHPTASVSMMREAKLSQKLNSYLVEWAHGTL